MHYYEIAPTIIVRRGADTYTYHSDIPIATGTIVHIDIGRRRTHGVVMRETDRPKYNTRPIESLHEEGVLPIELLKVATWMAKYYVTPLATVLTALLPAGLDKTRRYRPRKDSTPVRNRTNFVLNTSQIQATERLLSMQSGSGILHGVTGSGKTAVYIELAKRTLLGGRSVVILVPEIALTTQVVDEFSQHFPEIIITHSRQTEAQRHLAWLSALSSTEPRVIVGPRSALFMPLADIGLIILDECHEPSYKQDKSPRYYTPRVASVLASAHGARVVYGSATPPISEYYLASAHNRPIAVLPHRAISSAYTPDISLIDMTKKNNFRQHRFLSDSLLSAITNTLDSGHQVLIFHNRRGSAAVTLCENCGWMDLCPDCHIPRTLHIDAHSLRCHMCGRVSHIPTSCPVCHGTEIIHRGIGTKLIESELSRLYPDAKIARFDGDNSMDNTLDKRYREVYSGDIDIIIGTQVVAKGLDLPRLETVGVLQADAGLSLPDFASSERTFQLISQVVGRVGRSDRPSRVVVQSYQPDHPSVAYGIAQDYDSFYHHTITERRRDHFPPFKFLLRLTCTYKTENLAVKHTSNLAALLNKKYTHSIQVLGPTPSFYEMSRGRHRWQLIIKSTQRNTLEDIAAQDLPSKHWQADIDPLSLL